MSEFRIIENPDRSPSSCVACGSHVGPFVDLDTTIAQVSTTVGVMDLDIGFLLCVGSAESPGCVVQMARQTGLMIDKSVYDRDTGRWAEKVADLDQQLTQAVEERVVPLADVQKLLGGTRPATTQKRKVVSGVPDA